MLADLGNRPHSPLQRGPAPAGAQSRPCGLLAQAWTGTSKTCSVGCPARWWIRFTASALGASERQKTFPELGIRPGVFEVDALSSLDIEVGLMCLGEQLVADAVHAVMNVHKLGHRLSSSRRPVGIHGANLRLHGTLGPLK